MDTTGPSPWQRQWTHEESPSGRPSASARRLGCRCGECDALYRAYMKEYRSHSVPLNDNGDGTTYYHSHKGQPSATTAVRWGCVHPRCLRMGGLYLDPKGVVRVRADDSAVAGFGLPKEKKEGTTA